MNDTVVKLCQFAGVPPVGRAHQIAGDALDSLKGCATLRTCLAPLVGILIAAIGTVIAIVVDRPITHIILIHHIDDLHDRLFIVSGIPIDLDIEDMTTQGDGMIGCLHFRLMTRRTVIIDRHMVRVGVIFLVGYAGDDAE